MQIEFNPCGATKPNEVGYNYKAGHWFNEYSTKGSLQHPEPVRNFFASKTEIFADFTEVEQAYFNAATVELTSALFSMSIFKPCFQRFFETQMGLARQTPAALNFAIIHFVENVLPISLGSARIEASVTSTSPAGYVAIADVQDMIQQALAVHEAHKPGASKTGAA